MARQRTCAYCLQNLGVTCLKWGCCIMPSTSWYTSTCPLVCGPAPMPMVGTPTAAVTAAPTAGGTHSTTRATQPARSKAWASRTTFTAAWELRPCGRKPPRLEMDCGVRPTCPTTAMPASVMALAAAARRVPPPSILTASMFPSLRTRTADCTASYEEDSYVPKGKSASRKGLRAPRDTERQCAMMSSSVTGSVVSCPCTTMPTESPTRRTSIAARSTCTAEG
mmetsp:Transcript_11318/g.41417  ORF Transcript_11318/g.41417 Transcript_11318/m.41417 type:complete len:223 (-) Transcript_11318:379-1047(-)|eukprot:scaffold4_cov396-Prasinococcus_capsulatus_cf.AAC.7